MASLSLKHIYKVYPNGTKAVNDFNMQIADKEFIVFVGPSGCGKSTTLRMIAGLEKISAGELKIGDVVVNGMEPKDRDIAMVFQNYALYPHMTIYENIAFGLQMRKLPKEEIDKRVKEAASVLGITDYLKKKPKEMSGGQRQRVALGRAIVREPKVMLLDEPLSNLDAKLRTQMRSEIVKLHKKLQTTFIYVTHDQVEAMTMGTRIVVMKDGFVKQIDTPKNLYKYPANKFVAGFIGTPQMNFFDCTLKRIGDNVSISFVDSDAKITVPYAMLMKTTPRYLNGDVVVTIGFRAEDISLNPEKVKDSDAVIKVKISHTEELGTETLVYGDINMNCNELGESPTRVIIKSAGFKEYVADDVCEAAINLEAVHLFDKDTEECISPRIPKFNYLDCTVGAGKLSFCGNVVELPSAIQCADGEGQLLLPVDAVKFGGNIHAEIVDCENVSGQHLVSLDVNGRRLFALSDVHRQNGKITLAIDFKKVTLKVADTQIEPMPVVNGFKGRFLMENVVETEEINGKPKNKKVARYSLLIDGVKLPSVDEISEKMFAAMSGRRIFNTELRYEWSPYDVKIAKEGLPAKVEKVLDYGDETFLQCSVNGEKIYVRSNSAASGEIKLMPDVSKVSVVEIERGIRIV